MGLRVITTFDDRDEAVNEADRLWLDLGGFGETKAAGR